MRVERLDFLSSVRARLVRSRVARVLPVAIALLAGACFPARHRYVLVFDAAHPEQLDSVPARVAVGDSIYLQVRNAVLADRYAQTLKVDSLVEVLGPTVAGAVSVGRMTDVVSLTGALSGVAKATDTNQKSWLEPRTDSVNGATKAERALDEAVATATRTAAAPTPGAPLAAYAALARAIVTYVEARRQSGACDDAVAALAVDLRRTPAHAAVLAFAFDPTARVMARALTHHAFPRRVAALGDELGDTIARPDPTRPEVLLPDSAVRARRVEAESYARALALLALRLGADAAPATPDDKLSDAVGAVVSCSATDRARVDRATALLTQLADRAGITSLAAMPSLAPPGTRAGGVEFAPLFTTAGVDALATFADDLASITRDAARAIATLNTLPRYTRDTSSRLIPIGVYDHPVRLTIGVARTDRFGAYTLAPTVAVLPLTTRGAPSAGGTVAKAADSTAPAAPGRVVPTVDVPRATTPNGDPLPSVQLDVLRRYQYRFSVGLAGSSLNARRYEVLADTLRDAGPAATRVLPMATLSYALLPRGGQFLAAQARPSMGLWAQLGLSLNKPTEQFFVGLGTDVLTGVMLSGGVHFGYVDQPNVAVDDAVPPSRLALRHAWRRGLALGVNVDAATVVGAFGALLGIAPK